MNETTKQESTSSEEQQERRAQRAVPDATGIGNQEQTLVAVMNSKSPRPMTNSGRCVACRFQLGTDSHHTSDELKGNNKKRGPVN